MGPIAVAALLAFNVVAVALARTRRIRALPRARWATLNAALAVLAALLVAGPLCLTWYAHAGAMSADPSQIATLVGRGPFPTKNVVLAVAATLFPVMVAVLGRRAVR